MKLHKAWRTSPASEGKCIDARTTHLNSVASVHECPTAGETPQATIHTELDLLNQLFKRKRM